MSSFLLAQPGGAQYDLQIPTLRSSTALKSMSGSKLQGRMPQEFPVLCIVTIIIAGRSAGLAASLSNRSQNLNLIYKCSYTSNGNPFFF